MPETITVISSREVASGTSKSSGKPWTLRELRAVDVNGQEIVERLKTFESLPTDEPLEVEMDERNDPKYGVEFLVRRVGRSRTRTGSETAASLERRVANLEKRVAALEPAEARTVRPSAPPPADDEIPF